MDAFPPVATGIVPDVRKIAVLRANGLGDYVFTVPALEALRAAYPRAEIVLLGKHWHKDFLERRAGPVDRVVVVPPSRGVNGFEDAAEDLRELEAFFAAMVRERFDLALQLHGGGRHSNPFLLRLGARHTAGLKTPDAPPLDRWIPYIYFQREVDRFLETVALVGAAPIVLEPRIAVTPADVAEALPHAPAETPIVAVHPGAGSPERRWPPELFAAVGDALAAEGARVAVTGTESECAMVAAVIAHMRHEALDLCGQLTLGGLAGLLSRCAVVVSNDSGPLHLARAVGAATVGIYWCFNLVNAGPMTRARHRPLISWRTVCSECGTDRSHARCPHHASFVTDVPVAKVRDAALDLLHSAIRSERDADAHLDLPAGVS